MALEQLVSFERFSSTLDDSNQNIDEEIGTLTPKDIVQLPITPSILKTNVDLADTANGRRIVIKPYKGTTTLSFKYQGGIVVAVDSRATGGDLIFSGSVMKIIKINKYLLGTMAGGAADCGYWHRTLSVRCRLYELRNKERISVAAASKLLANILYSYKGMGISMGTMIIGWDKKGPGLYYVDNDGSRHCGDLFSAGSGSPFALSVLETYYKYDMSDEEAFELGRRSIYHAVHRDGASGGTIRIYTMKEDGWHRISEEDGSDLGYKYAEEKMV